MQEERAGGNQRLRIRKDLSRSGRARGDQFRVVGEQAATRPQGKDQRNEAYLPECE